MTTYTIELNVTDKEKKIVGYLADGYSTPEIGEIMTMNVRTLEANIASLKKKYSSKTLAELVATFLRNKLID